MRIGREKDRSRRIKRGKEKVMDYIYPPMHFGISHRIIDKPTYRHTYIYHAKFRLNSTVWGLAYAAQLHTLYLTLHCARILNNVVLTAVTEMVEKLKYWMKELVSV